MKKIPSVFATLFTLLITLQLSAQTSKGTPAQNKADYFPGKWNVLVKGTPNGDAKMIVDFQRRDTALTATLLDSTGTEAGEVNKVIENPQSVTIYFTAQGYNVDLNLEKKDDDHLVGRLMSMFDATGERIKDEKSK
jgi:hypothetical protein